MVDMTLKKWQMIGNKLDALSLVAPTIVSLKTIRGAFQVN